MKKIISGLVMLCAALFFSTFGSAEERLTWGDFEYVIMEDGFAKIVGYTGWDATCIVPESVDGIMVTEIGENAFYNSMIDEIYLPYELRRIGDRAFCYCENLFVVTLPNAVQSIGDEAFFGCKHLLVINLEVVEEIGDEAFGNCTEIEFLTIAANAEYIGINPFSGCEKMNEILVDSESGRFTVENGVLIDQFEGRVVSYPPARENEKVEIPEGINQIGAKAFLNCKHIKHVQFPKSLITIGEKAFDGCYSLSELNFPEQLSKIDNYAFRGCSSIIKASLPNAATVLGVGLFSDAYDLEEIDLPEGIVKIENNMFARCRSLTSFEFPASVTEIGEGAFSECTFKNLVIPNTVTVIADTAFKGCYQVEFTVEEGSIAESYAEDHGIFYRYIDSEKWLYE